MVRRVRLADRRGCHGLAGVECQQDGKKQVNKEKEREKKMEKIYPQPVTPGTTDVFSVVELITPDRAQKMLASSPGNRKSRAVKIERYAAQMKEGKWCLVPDHIAVDENCQLINGHNRLAAVIKSNISVLMQVDYNIKRKDMPSIDIGSVRTPADMLYFLFSNINNYTMVAGAVRMLVAWYKSGETRVASKPMDYVTNAEIIDFVRDNEEEITSIKSIVGMPGSPATVFAAAFILRRIDRTKTDEFMSMIKEGYGYGKKSPILALRDQLLERKFHSNVERINMLAKVFKAWNLWRNNKECGCLKWADNESFPIPQ